MPSNAVTVASNAFNKAEKALEKHVSASSKPRSTIRSPRTPEVALENELEDIEAQNTSESHSRTVCTRFVIASSAKDLASDLQTKGPWMEELSLPSFNVAPFDRIPVLHDQEADRRVTVRPFGVRRQGRVHLNGRIESLSERPMFRPHLMSGRVVIPMSVGMSGRSPVQASLNPITCAPVWHRPLSLGSCSQKERAMA